MHIRRLLAWILSAALAVSLLAGCGREDVLKLLLALLEGQYTNLTVEADADLEQTLRRVAGENSSEEEMDAALQKILGTTVQFEDLENGQSGEHSFDLVFQPGHDAESAARQTFLKWDKVFSSLPSGGQYHADLAMLEADNGYYILVEVTVKKAGSHGSSSSDNDDDKNTKPDPGYTVEDGTYKVTSGEGLEAVAEKIKNNSKDVVIELENDITLPDNWTPIGTGAAPFEGKLQGNNHTITMGSVKLVKETISTGAEGMGLHIAYAGLFGYIGDDGNVQKLEIKQANFNFTAGLPDVQYLNVGVVAGINFGQVSACSVTNGSIRANGFNVTAGSIVGLNQGVVDTNGKGTVSDCSAANTMVEVTGDTVAYAGGLVGTGGAVGGRASGTITATGERKAYAGGLVGFLDKGGSMNGTWDGGAITAEESGTSSTTVNTDQEIGGQGTTERSGAYAGTKIGFKITG